MFLTMFQILQNILSFLNLVFCANAVFLNPIVTYSFFHFYTFYSRSIEVLWLSVSDYCSTLAQITGFHRFLFFGRYLT